MVKREAYGVRVGQAPRTPGVLLYKIKCAKGRWAKKNKNKAICLTLSVQWHIQEIYGTLETEGKNLLL